MGKEQQYFVELFEHSPPTACGRESWCKEEPCSFAFELKISNIHEKLITRGMIRKIIQDLLLQILKISVSWKYFGPKNLPRSK